MQPAHRKLNRRDMCTLGLASLGGALEFYDFIIFVFFTKIISHLFFPENIDGWIATTLTFGIFAAGYLVRPVGGILFSLIACFFYYYAGISVGMLFVMSAFLGFFAGFVGAVAYVMVHAFPAAVRFSGLSFSYNISYAIFGGLTPVMISLIQYFVPMAHVWYLAGIGGLASFIGLYLLAFGERRHVSASIKEGPADHLSSQPS